MPVYMCAEGLLQELEEREKREKHERQAQGLSEEEVQPGNTVKTCNKNGRISKKARPDAYEGKWERFVDFRHARQKHSRQAWQDEFEGKPWDHRPATMPLLPTKSAPDHSYQ